MEHGIDRSIGLTFIALGIAACLSSSTVEAQTASASLNASGRLVIDVPNQRYLILDLDGNLNLGQGAFASAPAESFRYYELAGDELRVEVRDAAGRVTTRIRYRRAG